MGVGAVAMVAEGDIPLLGPLLTPRLLHLILLPTEACNFRCTYCYEDFAAGRMPPHVVASLKELIARRAPELQLLALSWFGGEPLVAREVVLDVSRYAQALALAHPGMSIRNGITTNGWFLDHALAGDLLAAGVNDYQITLDGFGAVHDRTRLRADGAGSFDQIWRNLLGMRDRAEPFAVTLRVHIHPGNIADVGVLIDALRVEFIPDPRFVVAFHAVGRWGGADDESYEVYTAAQAGPLIEELRERTYAGLREIPPPAGHIAGADAPIDACYASKANSFVIRSDGRVGKCTVALRDPQNTVGTLAPGGKILLDPARVAPWLRGLTDVDLEVLRCPYEGLKHGASSDKVRSDERGRPEPRETRPTAGID